MSENDEVAIRSIATTFAVIEVVERLDDPTLGDVVDEVNPSKSTVYKHLSTLKTLGYVTSHRRTYQLTDRFERLGTARGTDDRRPDVAISIVSRLARDVGTAAGLYVRNGSQGVTQIQQTDESAESDGFSIEMTPYLHACAPGKAILSTLSEDEVQAVVEDAGLPTVGPKAITTADELSSELDRVRGLGIAFERSEQADRVNGVAVPTTSIATAGAIYVVGPSERLDGKRFEQDIPGVLQSANEQLALQRQSDQ